ncbi:MAG: methyltransferase, partial [Caulobacteraceae bacterium]
MVRHPDPITSNDGLLEGVYGHPPAALARLGGEARRFTPLDPSGQDLAEASDALLDRLVILAPPGTLERQGVIAHGLRVLKPGGKLIVLARKDLGGMRLAAELTRLGCRVVERSKAHHRICACQRPQALDRLEAAIAQAGPRFIPQIGLWSQPGLFSWDRIDSGSALLLERLG